MYKLRESPRIENIEDQFGKSIETILYNWHWKGDLKHSEISEKIGVPRSTVTRWFRHFSVPTQSCTRFTNLNLLNVGPKKTPPAKPKIKKARPWRVNEDFFKQWNSEMAYVLGFFYADGSMLVNSRGSHYIIFNITDRDLLMEIKNLISVGHKLSLRRTNVNHNWKKSWRLQIGSKNTFKQLRELGVTPRKSDRIRMPQISLKYTPDFTRGYFDGDGRIWYGFTHKKDRETPTKMLISTFTSSNKGMLQDVASCLHKMADIKLKSPTFQDRAFRLYYSTNDSRKIYKFIYNNKSNLYLNRKKVIFEKYLGA